ncbi:MAG: hypothetical protein ACOVNL_05660 [Prochlorococcaceae cyanobacterium]|jgi:2'-5' RNA ligase
MSGPRPNWFLALPLPRAAGWAVEPSCAALPQGLRCLAAADLHLTLAFLGPCGQAQAQAAWEALAVLRQPPVLATAGAWRALGAPGRPSAWGLTLTQGHREVTGLMARGRPAALAAAGLPPERRDPLPHVTLLRPTRREAEQQRRQMAERLAQLPLPQRPALLEQLALYTWAEGAVGAAAGAPRYRIVEQRSLAGGDP